MTQKMVYLLMKKWPPWLIPLQTARPTIFLMDYFEISYSSSRSRHNSERQGEEKKKTFV